MQRHRSDWQPLCSSAFLKIKLLANNCICTHNLQKNVNSPAFFPVMQEQKKRHNEEKIDWEKMLNKAKMPEENEERAGGWMKGFLTVQMMNPECTLLELTWALHPLSGPTQLSAGAHKKPISTLH